MTSHFAPRASKTVLRPVDPKWLKHNAEVGVLANRWSRRADLQAYIGPEAGRGQASALFDPKTGEIEINTDVAFGEFVLPEDIGDLTKRGTHLVWPKAAGMILHESGHAIHTSQQMLEEASQCLKGRESKWFMAMEEPRIEGRMARELPNDRLFLKSSALEIVLGDMKDEDITKITATEYLVHTAILTLGRVDAGVLNRRDVLQVSGQVEDVLPAPMLKELAACWQEFLGLNPLLLTGRNRMYQLARDVEKLVKDNENANGEMSGQDLMQAIFDAITQAVNGDRAGTEIETADEVAEVAADEASQEAAAERERENIEQGRNTEQARKTFQNSTGPNDTKSRSRVRSRREPTAEERTTAARVAQALRRARYRERTLTQTVTVNPPGRLRVGVAMQARAAETQAGRGARGSYQPWTKKTRRHTENPTLTVGIMCDISGSMTEAEEPIAVSAWVMSNAVKQVHGRAAAVYYGNDVFSVLRPGETLDKVTVYSASDGSEDFSKAFRALDGGLKMLTGTGARLLVICSDGQYRAEEGVASREFLQTCKKTGVAVIWLDYHPGGSSKVSSICEETGSVHVLVGRHVTDAAQAIGDACVEALKKAS